jgi:hypothetical protein
VRQSPRIKSVAFSLIEIVASPLDVLKHFLLSRGQVREDFVIPRIVKVNDANFGKPSTAAFSLGVVNRGHVASFPASSGTSVVTMLALCA